ncbi:DUF896 domain-containing protein [Paenibacillus alkaliterrae]|uniref:DUF896 domain-containing protein n=1 Tax=Paenibacillus alkaliterrae TaxID=320909 RepID=UPI001F485C4F|nr:DUF896 domain-containing protein [Paenibacillus alkaliterrae]MCF2938302.1 DUF896 domain-containing protein [Paenibacillus alkaliterrae]
MEFEKIIARINELSRKNKTVGLTDAETTERNELRQQYLNNFKRNFRQQLDNITVVDGEDEVKR